VGNDPACLTVREALADRLHHVEVVHDVVKAAIIGQSIEERSNGVFDSHKTSKWKRRFEYTTGVSFSQVLDQTDW